MFDEKISIILENNKRIKYLVEEKRGITYRFTLKIESGFNLVKIETF